MAEAEKNATPEIAALPELLACPFCGARMYWFSNRDWHRIRGEHDDDCIFDRESDALMVPATDEAKAEGAEEWNRRANDCAACGHIFDIEDGLNEGDDEPTEAETKYLTPSDELPGMWELADVLGGETDCS